MLNKRLKQLISVGLIAVSVLGSTILAGCNDRQREQAGNVVKTVIDKSQQAEQNKNSKNSNDFTLQATKEQPANTVKATVVRVVDGDTIVVKDNGGEKKIRFLLIDTPETCKPKTPVQPFGQKAKDFTKTALPKGSQICVQYGKSKSDKYGRCLGYIYYKDNGKWKMLNEELVAEGLARVGYIYKDKDHLEELEQAQDYAKKKKLNIWSKAGYVTDKGFNPEVFNK